MSLIKLSCSNCSGKLSHVEKDIYKCEYCDTYYRFENNTTINIENYNANTPKKKSSPNNKFTVIGSIILLILAAVFIFNTILSEEPTSSYDLKETTEHKPKQKNIPVRTTIQSPAMKEFEAFFTTVEKKSLADIKAFRVVQRTPFDKNYKIEYSFSGSPSDLDSYFKDSHLYEFSEAELPLEKEDLQLLKNVEFLDLNHNSNVTYNKDIYGYNSSTIYKPLTKLTYLRGTSDDSVKDLLEGLYDPTNIRGLDINLNNEEDITTLANSFKKLDSLSVSLHATDIENSAKLGAIAELPLKRLSLNLSSNFKNIDWLSKGNSIESLKIEGGSIKDWTFLSPLTNLTTLKIDDEKFNNSTIIGQLPKLTDLTIENNSIRNWQPIEDKTSLTKLTLNLERNPFHVTKLTNLVDLNLHFGPINNRIQAEVALLSKLQHYATDSLEPIPLNQIKEINITNVQGFPTNQIVPDMKNLEEMILSGDFRYADFGNYPTIKKLTVDFPDSGIRELGKLSEQLSHFSEVSELAFYNLQSLNGTDTAFKNLKKVIISNQDTGTGVIEPAFIINNAPNMESLQLTNTSVTKLDPLVNLKKLKFLNFRGNAVTLLDPLDKLPHLEIALTSGNPLSNTVSPNKNLTLLP
ncbi:leucine-rich repeat domain-containing protein [Vagococcus fessus]|uniref:Cell wall anchor protein n=1 Tax=Vagococcus fessus TaxID=120370 RepID=A0A430A6I5_9ENTE|nr:hypothetical protein [Vagococcus fessus]RSU02489.1 hypothetical protein CBF31_08970 [Vagococcus fessus]